MPPVEESNVFGEMWLEVLAEDQRKRMILPPPEKMKILRRLLKDPRC